MDKVYKTIKFIRDTFPTKGVKIGYGDFNDNGKEDVLLEVFLDNGKVMTFGPFDVDPGEFFK